MIFKVSHPIFIPKEERMGIKLGTMTSISVSENFLQLNAIAKGRSIFRGATIALGTTHMPMKGYDVVFGFGDEKMYYGVVEEKSVSGVEGSFHYVTEEFNEHGKIKFVCYHINRVIFQPPPHSAVARNGKSVTVTEFSLVGTVLRPKNMPWRTREIFPSAEAALEQMRLDGYIWYE